MNIDRVLLSRKQVEALVRFVSKHKEPRTIDADPVYAEHTT